MASRGRDKLSTAVFERNRDDDLQLASSACLLNYGSTSCPIGGTYLSDPTGEGPNLNKKDYRLPKPDASLKAVPQPPAPPQPSGWR